MTKVIQKSENNEFSAKNSNLIAYPVLDFSLSKLCIDHRIKEINTLLDDIYAENKALSKEYLRDSHAELLYVLIRMYRNQISKNNFKNSKNAEKAQIDLENLPFLETSNQDLQNKLEGLVNVSTIYRRLKRLEKHNFITEKVLHGRTNMYEVALNPEILAFLDLANLENLPKNEALATPYGNELLKHKIASCNVSSVSFINDTNKEINKRSNLLVTFSVDGKSQVDKFGNLSITRDPFLNDSQTVELKNTPNLANFASFESFYKQNLKRTEETIEHLRKQAAMRLLALYFTILMKYTGTGTTVEFENEVQKEFLVNYIDEKYFSHCKSNHSINQTIEKYEWCIRKSEEIVKFRRSKQKIGYVQYAKMWFDNENYDGGFIGLFKKHNDWQKRNQDKVLKRKNTKNQAQNRLKYADACKNYMLHRITYKQLENYVSNNVPEYSNLLAAEMQAGGLQKIQLNN